MTKTRNKEDWVFLSNGSGDDKRTHYACCTRCGREHDLTTFFPISIRALALIMKALVEEHRHCSNQMVVGIVMEAADAKSE